MEIERRTTRAEDGSVVPRGLVLRLDPGESKLVDEVLGDQVIDDDGLIASGSYEVRLADGYGEHYIYLECSEQAKETHKNEA